MGPRSWARDTPTIRKALSIWSPAMADEDCSVDWVWPDESTAPTADAVRGPKADTASSPEWGGRTPAATASPPSPASTATTDAARTPRWLGCGGGAACREMGARRTFVWPGANGGGRLGA